MADKKLTPRDLADSYWWFVQQIMYGEQMIDNDGYERALKVRVEGSYYGLDAMRTKLHREMCEALGLTEEETKCITDHLDECRDFDDFFEKLLKLAVKKDDRNGHTERSDTPGAC